MVGRAQNFALNPGDDTAVYVDIASMAAELDAEPAIPAVLREQAQAITGIFDDLVVVNGYNNGTHPFTTIDSDYSRANGLSIYHPNSNRPEYTTSANPPYASLAFATDTGWADYLQLIAAD